MREWVGGKLIFPLLAEDNGRKFEPEVFLWIEMPEKHILGFHLFDPANPRMSSPESFMGAMSAPLFGPPRRPDRLRAESSSLITELRLSVNRVEFVWGPTPELDSVIVKIARRMMKNDREPTSYLGN